jgi:hypothetical protein
VASGDNVGVAMDLNEALGQFDLVDANLRRLDSVWKEMRDLIPDGISFGVGDAESRRYEELRRAYDTINSRLPPIDGCVSPTPRCT